MNQIFQQLMYLSEEFRNIENTIDCLRLVVIAYLGFVNSTNFLVFFKKVSIVAKFMVLIYHQIVQLIYTGSYLLSNQTKHVIDFQIKELLIRLRSNWLNLENEDEKGLFREHAIKGRSLIIYYSSKNLSILR